MKIDAFKIAPLTVEELIDLRASSKNLTCLTVSDGIERRLLMNLDEAQKVISMVVTDNNACPVDQPSCTSIYCRAVWACEKYMAGALPEVNELEVAKKEIARLQKLTNHYWSTITKAADALRDASPSRIEATTQDLKTAAITPYFTYDCPQFHYENTKTHYCVLKVNHMGVHIDRNGYGWDSR